MMFRSRLTVLAAHHFTVAELLAFEVEAEMRGDRRAADLWRVAVAEKVIGYGA